MKKIILNFYRITYFMLRTQAEQKSFVRQQICARLELFSLQSVKKVLLLTRKKI